MAEVEPDVLARFRAWVASQGSSTAAAKTLNVTQGMVSHVLNGRRVPGSEVGLAHVIERATNGAIKAEEWAALEAEPVAATGTEG